MVGMGLADRVADELIELLEMSISDIEQLGSTCGDEQLITTCLHQLQARYSTIVFFLS